MAKELPPLKKNIHVYEKFTGEELMNMGYKDLKHRSLYKIKSTQEVSVNHYKNLKTYFERHGIIGAKTYFNEVLNEYERRKLLLNNMEPKNKQEEEELPQVQEEATEASTEEEFHSDDLGPLDDDDDDEDWDLDDDFDEDDEDDEI